MARRIEIPEVAELLPSEEELAKADRLLDVMLRDSSPVVDEDFDVIDTVNLRTTTSSNPSRPRTVKAGYDYKSRTLTVVFRDGTWWDYRGVPRELWEAFNAAPSKGKFMREFGLDTWDDMGPTDINRMPRHRRAQLSDIDNFVKALYGADRNK